MSRALVPWLVPLALLIGVLVASVNSTLLDVVVWLVVAFVVLPGGLWLMRRAGTLPPVLQRMSERDENGRPRFPGF